MEFPLRTGVISFDHNHYAGCRRARERAMVRCEYPTLVAWDRGRAHGILDQLSRNERSTGSERVHPWDG